MKIQNKLMLQNEFILTWEITMYEKRGESDDLLAMCKTFVNKCLSMSGTYRVIASKWTSVTIIPTWTFLWTFNSHLPVVCKILSKCIECQLCIIRLNSSRIINNDITILIILLCDKFNNLPYHVAFTNPLLDRIDNNSRFCWNLKLRSWGSRRVASFL